ncbi:MAG: CRISPR-associated helicase Cas3' [Sulfolobaceae archaeon]
MENEILAKSLKEGRKITLKEHTEDVYRIARKLLDMDFSGNPPQHLKIIVELAALLHDIGKVDPVMQEILSKNIRAHPRRIDHALISYLLIDKNNFINYIGSLNIQDRNIDPYKIYAAVSRAVVFHHFRNSYLTTTKQRFLRLVQKNNDKNIQGEGEEKTYIDDTILDKLKLTLQSVVDSVNDDKSIKYNINDILVKDTAALSRVINNLPDVSRMIFKLKGELNIYYSLYDHIDYSMYREQIGTDYTLKYDYIYPLGLLMRADALASWVEENLGQDSIQKVIQDIKPFKLSTQNISKQFNNRIIWQQKLVNIIQEFVDKNRIKLRGVILIAPTGAGKSEFAFYLANMLRVNKIIYTLPIRSAIDALYWRFKDKYKYEDSVDLIHSTSYLSKYQFIESNMDDMIWDDVNIEYLLTLRETEEIGRQFVKPILFATGDQIYPATLRYPRFETVYSLLNNALLVNDELQQYTPSQIGILLNMLYDVKNMGGYFLFMTATIPMKIEDLKGLIEEDFQVIELGDDLDIKDIDTTKETVLLINAIKLVNKYHDLEDLKIALNNSSKIHNITTIMIDNQEDKKYEEEDYLNDVYNKLRDHLLNLIKERKLSRFLIIMNTVKRAQYLYEKLEADSNFKDFKKMLLHSRYTNRDRAELSKSLTTYMNNRSKQSENKVEENRIIAITTQVVEASLDIDADILFTEVAPIESLIQRMGRINRHKVFGESDRDFQQKQPNIFIILPKNTKNIHWLYSPYGPIIANIIDFLNQNSSEFLGSPISFEKKLKLVEKFYETYSEENKKSKEIKWTYEKYYLQIEESIEYIRSGGGALNRDDAQSIFRPVLTERVIPRCLVNELINNIKEAIEKNSEDIIFNIVSDYEISVYKYLIKPDMVQDTESVLRKELDGMGEIPNDIKNRIISLLRKYEIKIINADYDGKGKGLLLPDDSKDPIMI